MVRFEKIEHIITRFAARFALVGGMGLLLAVLITCVSIALKLLRRFLDFAFGGFFDTAPWAFVRPILGEEELVAFGVGFALFAALPWVMIQRGHIKIDLFEPMFGDRLNRLLDFIGDIALAAVGYLIFTRQWFLIFKKARRSQEPMSVELANGNWSVLGDRLRDSQESQVLGLPLWPTWIVAEICTGVFLVVAVFCVVRSGRALIWGRANAS
ncbi:MAG: TRAP transporter small permease [Planktomarina sp.]